MLDPEALRHGSTHPLPLPLSAADLLAVDALRGRAGELGARLRARFAPPSLTSRQVAEAKDAEVVNP